MLLRAVSGNTFVRKSIARHMLLGAAVFTFVERMKSTPMDWSSSKFLQVSGEMTWTVPLYKKILLLLFCGVIQDGKWRADSMHRNWPSLSSTCPTRPGNVCVATKSKWTMNHSSSMLSPNLVHPSRVPSAWTVNSNSSCCQMCWPTIGLSTNWMSFNRVWAEEVADMTWGFGGGNNLYLIQFSWSAGRSPHNAENKSCESSFMLLPRGFSVV